ncbi:efflux transporter outer membrane subunit [Pseudomonas sp. 10B1]|uniref:efflux transporter outer membrane subunit n=2 Tax=Pseudomonas TaxID=286 RepID=UPI002B23E61C|nr:MULTISPECIES: efflux transporter outer membrane subunit [unclassified Pseudomonas]MEB0218289.1 efflux transporter outer membrane subunit [Pseudomonas sp. AB12(2023)]MEA9993396.1 efflux transporter outer membrane subunit [Pseudomonas sp. AA4]MEB0088354.1 efflux transporter outer membrane subunit [Pseudomonas sp. RTI1]MEB0124117.1 efflux transporter outer membrane subunit [Pseudomonas sp. CCC1.2]MEB0152576.1 efflux transporter outer membrane subunit [Pseudomonas sp. CCC4.3]
MSGASMPSRVVTRLASGRVPRSLAFTAGLLLGGCSLVPSYHQPQVPIAPAWDAVQGLTGASTPGGPWWEEFHSDELNGLVAKGLTDNYTLKAAVSRIDEAQALAQVTGAAKYPLLSLGGNFQRQNNYGTTQKRSAFADATYEVDFWGKQRAAADSSTALAHASAFDAQTLRMTLGANIANTYFQVLSLDDRLRLAQSIAGDAQQVLDLVNVQAAQGAVSNLEVEQQRNALQTFQAAVPPLRQQRDMALYQLAVLVEVPPQGFKVTQVGLNNLAVPNPRAGLPVGLLRQRPDIQAAEARLRSANFDVGVARAAFLPNLSLDLQGGIDTLSGSNIWSMLGTLGQPVFAGGQLKGQLHLDQAHVQELTSSYRESVIEALQDVQTQLSAAHQLDQSYTLNVAAVTSAREAARLAQVRYRLGSTDFQTLLIVERTQYQAEDTLLQVRLQHLQAAVGLFRALGGDFSPASVASDVTPSTSFSSLQASRP